MDSRTFYTTSYFTPNKTKCGPKLEISSVWTQKRFKWFSRPKCVAHHSAEKMEKLMHGSWWCEIKTVCAELVWGQQCKEMQKSNGHTCWSWWSFTFMIINPCSNQPTHVWCDNSHLKCEITIIFLYFCLMKNKKGPWRDQSNNTTWQNKTKLEIHFECGHSVGLSLTISQAHTLVVSAVMGKRRVKVMWTGGVLFWIGEQKSAGTWLPFFLFSLHWWLSQVYGWVGVVKVFIDCLSSLHLSRCRCCHC